MLRWLKRIVLAVVVLLVVVFAGAVIYSIVIGGPPQKRPELLTELPADVPPPPRGWPSEYTSMAAGFLLYDHIPIENAPPMDGVRQTLDIPFSTVDGDRELLLDIFRPEGPDELRPGIVIYYGGGWRNGSKDQLRYYAQFLAKNGYVTITPEYRLREAGQWPRSIHDAKAAVRWMRAHAEEYHIDPERIGVMGNSAGAYLALMVAYTPDDPFFEGDGGWPDERSDAQAVVDIYGPVDFTEPERRDHHFVVGYMGGYYEESPDNYNRASPIRYVRADTAPTCVIHGTVDWLVPVHQSDWLVEALREHGVPHYYSRIDGWPHAMDAVERVNQHTRALALAFFNEHLRDRELPKAEAATEEATL